MIDGKTDSRKKIKADPSRKYVDYICGLYGDKYDDRKEDSKPQGKDWIPGESANHKSLEGFRKQLKNSHDISLSTVHTMVEAVKGAYDFSRDFYKFKANLF